MVVHMVFVDTYFDINEFYQSPIKNFLQHKLRPLN